MKRVFSILVATLFTAIVFLPRQVNAQSPEKMSYQAVIRDASDDLISDTQVGMQISILQGSASGTAVYTETQEPITNANGLVSLEIGTGTVQSSDFSTIDWANGPYFIKTETDPTGGTSYSITGTSQLLSVPYALHAKTADSVTGTITETDPVFGAWDKSTGITITESQISDLDHFTTADETDPVFDASVASGITGTDTTNWNNKLDSESDPVFGAWDKSTGISITESQISDLDHFTTADESDPVFDASVASGITGTDTTNWNNKLDSESDPVFGAWDKSTGISITESQISDLDHFTTADETDPVYSLSVASGITGTDTTNWNNKLDSETDPIFGASVASEITYADTTNWNNKLDSESDPVFTAWDKNYEDLINAPAAADGSETKVTAGTNVSVTGTGTTTNPYVINASGAASYSVGDFAYGGIVFWVDESGQHGLVCAKEDQDGGSGIQWDNGSGTSSSARGDGLYAGEMNTILIIANSGSNCAAGVCAGYKNTGSTDSYGDWYLPSLEELELMYQNKSIINITATANAGSNFANEEYWSSTEYNNVAAYRMYFNDGGQGYTGKSNTYRVRAVRAF